MLTRLLGQLAGLMGTLVYKLTRTLYYDMRWARSILEHTGARAICFDHILPKRYVVNSFLKAAREMSIPALSLPHGVLLYTNEKTKPKSTDKRRFTKFSRFNFILVPNQLRKAVLVRTGVAEEKIFVLGSARYCGEWLEQNKTILPRVIEPNISSSDKLKVVFMQSKPQCRVDLERMSKTIDLLADLAEIEAVLKPHTRTAGEKRQLDETRLPDVSHVLTAELCEWADVLLVVGSSVITEALMNGKPVLYLKYLHENTTLFEDLGACWIISNETELKMALLALQKNKTDIPYGANNITEFISEIVYGGGRPRDVLSDYEQFIVGCASN
jgi:UDP-N-acetylglucosamine 2-epimerase